MPTQPTHTGDERLSRARVYDSLQRRPHLLGLPQDAFLLLALVMVCLCIAARLDPAVLAGCAVVYVALLPPLRRLFENEPYLMEIIPRAMRYSERYPRQARERPAAWTDRVFASVP